MMGRYVFHQCCFGSTIRRAVGKAMVWALCSAAVWGTAAPPELLRILDPEKSPTTVTREAVNVMGKTLPDARVTVGGVPAKVFATGIFVRDQVPLEVGTNAIVVEARHGARREATTIVVNRALPLKKERTTEPQALRIDAKSVEPSGDVIATAGEEFIVSCEGTPGQIAEFRLGEGPWRPLVELEESVDGLPSGKYRGVCVAPATLADGKPRTLGLRLRAKSGADAVVKVTGPEQIEIPTKTQVTVWGSDVVRLVRTRGEMTGLVHGLHEVRLGGPYVTVLPPGIVLRVTGKQSGNWHVRLCPTLDAWVSEKDVEMLPEGSAPPHLFFTLVSVGGDELSDMVTIPYPRDARVPYAVSSGVGPAGRPQIFVDFFGAHHAATWISHRPTAQVVREVCVEQPAQDWVRVRVDLSAPQLWGYLVDVTTNSLVLRVRRPPELAQPPKSPVAGLVIALEAGHGGSNTGALGVSGSLEKDINRMAVDELARQLEAKGAKVIMAREGDTNPNLAERARRATESSATLFISVHANSADQTRGYLRVSGTSTYYKHSFCRDLADAVHKRLLEMTGLGDFGNVGNFNYLPIRELTWMPSMLVEQAFMSNPEDEAKMLDPKFRATMMKAVVKGIEDWLETQRQAQMKSQSARSVPKKKGE